MAEMNVLDRTGDTKIEWDHSNADEVAAARAMFNMLKEKKYRAYSEKGKGKDADRIIIHEFDRSADRIIMTPQRVGG